METDLTDTMPEDLHLEMFDLADVYHRETVYRLMLVYAMRRSEGRKDMRDVAKGISLLLRKVPAGRTGRGGPTRVDRMHIPMPPAEPRRRKHKRGLAWNALEVLRECARPMAIEEICRRMRERDERWARKKNFRGLVSITLAQMIRLGANNRRVRRVGRGVYEYVEPAGKPDSNGQGGPHCPAAGASGASSG